MYTKDTYQPGAMIVGGVCPAAVLQKGRPPSDVSAEPNKPSLIDIALRIAAARRHIDELTRSLKQR